MKQEGMQGRGCEGKGMQGRECKEGMQEGNPSTWEGAPPPIRKIAKQ